MRLGRPTPVAAIVAIWVTTGCQSFSHHIRNYDGPPLGTNQIALLKVEWKLGDVMLSVNRIDHQRPKRYYASEIELLPGAHDLEVSYQSSNGHSTADAKISFIAERGGVYELKAAPLEVSLKREIAINLVPFSRWYWTLWIMDAHSGKVVAGTPRETPRRWYE